MLCFNGNKMITTSGGGALICRDAVDKENVVYYATQARVGYNYRLSNVCAGIGIGPKMVAYVNGVSESVFKVGMCLPAGPYVTDSDVEYIVESIKKAME